MDIKSQRRVPFGVRKVWAITTLFLLALGLAAVLRHQYAPRRAVLRAISGPAVPSLFRDVAREAGVRFQYSNGASGKFYYAEATGSGCAFFDYNNDGFQDILLVQSGPMLGRKTNDPANWCRLFRNNRNGSFTDVTRGSGLDRDLGYAQGVAIGDYDNDGYDDIFITGYGGNHLLHNEHGSGRFVDVTRAAGLTDTEHGPRYATSAAFGDYDNDGYLDLFVCHYAIWTPKTNRTCRNAANQLDYCSPNILIPDTERLYHNNHNCTFTDVSRQSGIGASRGRGLAVAWLDYDEDGRQDIYVANDLNSAFLWHNDGGGKFSDHAMAAGCAYDNTGQAMAGMGIGIVDYNHSGHQSLFVSNFSQQPNSLFRGGAGGQFTDVSVPAGVALPHMKFLTFGNAFLDYDADGWPDIICANGHVEIHAPAVFSGITYAERKQLFHNEGDGRFSEVTRNLGDLAIPTVSRGLAVGDYDNDGRLDVLVNNQNGSAQLFRNEVRNGNHWVSFLPVGTRSNRDGYGARFALSAGSLHQTDVIFSGGSYASQSDRRAYFGLGDHVAIDRVNVVWPSGLHELITNVRPDHSYVVTEGRGITSVLPSARPRGSQGP